MQIYASNGESEVPDFFEGARSRDLVEPLTKEELPPFNTWKWLTWSEPPPYHRVTFISHALPVRITQSTRRSLQKVQSWQLLDYLGLPAGLSRCTTLTRRWASVTTACPLQACWLAAGCW